MKHVTAIILFISFNCCCFAQQKQYIVKINPSEAESYCRSTTDSIHWQSFIGDILSDFYSSGYISVSVDSVVADTGMVVAEIFRGAKYKWGNDILDSVPCQILKKARIKESDYNGAEVNIVELFRIYEKLIVCYENTGYPFVSVSLNDLKIIDSTVYGYISCVPNKLFTIDTLIIKGNARISGSYVYRRTGILPGQVYSEKDFRLFNNYLNDIPFLLVIKPAEISFMGDKASVYAYLDNRQANFFNGFAGLQPGSNAAGKLQLTGEMELLLQNITRRGERTAFHWTNPRPLTQKLETEIQYPYIFSSSFGLYGAFSLYKSDTTYINSDVKLGITYFLKGNNYLLVTHERIRSSVLLNRKLLPEQYSDNLTQLFGLGFNFSSLNSIINPSRGVKLFSNVSGGYKKDDNDNTSGVSDVYSYKIDLQYFIPAARRFVLMIGGKSAAQFDPEMYENDVFRVGGLQTIRGFLEEEFPATSYTVATIEPRFIFDKNSYFMLFADQAYIEKNTRNSFDSRWITGAGAGIQIYTKAGIAGIAYGVGKRPEGKWEFGKGKVHISYKNKF